MDEAVVYIDRRTAEHAGTFRLTPKRSLADLIDDLRHGLGRFDVSEMIATRTCRVQYVATAARVEIAFRGFNAIGSWTARGYDSRTSTKFRGSCGPKPMLTHAQIWTALDRLAALAGLSPSGLAKKSGLDPTAFNKSKRMTADGRARWPSTESLAKALTATGTSIDTLARLIDEPGRSGIKETIPLIGLAPAGRDGYFDQSGFPTGPGWEKIRFPALEDEHAFALEISGESMAPLYRDGTLIIASPAASIRRGDRVVIKTAAGEVMVRELKRRTARTIELRPIDPAHVECAFQMRDVLWIARIIWASQ
jgi:phage repressor protein C with HTH and peptisase S24 domain